MKKSKAVLMLLVLISLVFNTNLYANASEKNNTFLHEYLVSSEDELKLYASNIFEKTPDKEALLVEVGSQNVDVKKISSSDSVPTLYYCLIDLSASISKARFQQETDALKAIADKMGEKDCVIIGSLGDSVKLTDKMSDKNEILEYIDSLKVGHEDTNLYKGIVDSIDALQSDNDDNMQKCLVLLSDGQDDQKTGITENEALEAIQTSHIPVFSIAVLAEKPTNEQIEYAKVLGSFARNSAGGIHCAPILDKVSANEAGQAIVNEMQKNIVISLDTSDVKDQAEKKDSLLINVSVKDQDGKTYTDELTVLSSKLKFSESEPGFSIPLILIVGLLAVVIVIIVVFVLRKRKDKNEKDVGNGENDVGIVTEGENSGDKVTEEKGEDNPVEIIDESVEPSILVLWFTINSPEKNEVQTILTSDVWHSFGRNDKSEFILNSNDKKLSSINFFVKWESNDENKLWLYDRDSSNGTFLNGVPIREQGAVVLESGSMVRAGSFEYRVIIDKVIVDNR